MESKKTEQDTTKLEENRKRLTDALEKETNRLKALGLKYGDTVTETVKKQEKCLEDVKKITTIASGLSGMTEEQITAVYRSEMVAPPMDTLEEMRVARWKYYPDSYIHSFGETVAVAFGGVLSSTEDSMAEQKKKLLEILPAGFNVLDTKAHVGWTRDDVKKFVNGMSKSELIGMGY